jgi:hypothetical protein
VVKRLSADKKYFSGNNKERNIVLSVFLGASEAWLCCWG